jgi:hypothetical protein
MKDLIFSTFVIFATIIIFIYWGLNNAYQQ